MSSLAALSSLGGETTVLVNAARRSLVVVYSRRGHGSGVVWGAGGLIVTNHHVAPQERADVELGDGARVTAPVVARDTENDLALLRLDAGLLPRHDLTPVSLGDSQNLAVGELVLAVGHPLGVRGTATLGIVSASRETRPAHAGRELLQVDIALSPGSSGGPLVDTAGRLIGLASMIMSPGIALAVPAHVVRQFVCRASAAGRGDRERRAAGLLLESSR